MRGLASCKAPIRSLLKLLYFPIEGARFHIQPPHRFPGSKLPLPPKGYDMFKIRPFDGLPPRVYPLGFGDLNALSLTLQDVFSLQFSHGTEYCHIAPSTWLPE